MLDEHMGPIKKYSILTVGAVVLALANYVFKFPNHFSFGGVAGFAVILSGMFGGSASTYTFVINMLLLLIAFPILERKLQCGLSMSVSYSVVCWKLRSMCIR